MKTSKEWWDEVKVSPVALEDWLQKQYTGEVTAADRIVKLGEQFTVDTKAKSILAAIAQQEETHATWIKELLESRGITPTVGDANKRYWAKTMPGITDFETGTAVAAHAEKMRLERIRVISEDKSAPADIRETFKKILKDELWHEKAFRSLSTDEALNKTLEGHEQGMQSLGLVI